MLSAGSFIAEDSTMIRSMLSLLFIILVAGFVCLPAAAAEDEDEQAAAVEKDKGDREKDNDKDDTPDYRKRLDEARKERERLREERRKEREARKKKDKDDSEKEEEKPSAQQDQLKKAEKKLQDGDIIGAWSLFESISKQKDDEAAAKQAGESLKQIETKGQEEVKKAAAVDDPAEADRQLSALYKKYWRTPVKNALADAMKDVKLRKAQKGAGAPADDAAGSAIPLMPPLEGGDAADQPAEQNPDDLARMWLIVGDIHRLNNRPAEAADAYRKLVYEYPDSRFTLEARNKLDEIEAEASAGKNGDD